MSQSQDFTAKLKELENITKWFEAEDLDLDEALVKFERGMTLVSELKEHLGKVQNQVEKIKHKFSSVGGDEAITSEELEDSSLGL